MDALLNALANFQHETKELQTKYDRTQFNLKTAYEYKDNLYNAMQQADKQIEFIQTELFEHHNQLKDLQEHFIVELSTKIRTV